MRLKYFASLVLGTLLIISCSKSTETEPLNMSADNPFNVALNQPYDYAAVTSGDIEEYSTVTIQNVVADINAIKETESINFENTFGKLDGVMNAMEKANNNAFLLYWVSPDSLIRDTGRRHYQKLDSLKTVINSDKLLFDKLQQFAESDQGKTLSGLQKRLMEKVVNNFQQSGVNLNEADLDTFKSLSSEIVKLNSEFSSNLNTYEDHLILTPAEAEGLPENFKNTYRLEDGSLRIPIINATQGPVLSNAKSSKVRKAYTFKFYNRAVSNLPIIDSLMHKRHQLGSLMGYDSYAQYILVDRMAKTPKRVWDFLNNLVDAAKPKALKDVATLKDIRNSELNTPNNDAPINPWDVSYYNNRILKTTYNIDSEKVREYLPMDACLQGMLDVYQKLLGFKFQKIENASVWAEGIDAYNVYEGDTLRGRFYLDLFPRPNKETWFYGVTINPGLETNQGYEVPQSMLLGNFTKPTNDLPSLLSYNELNILFHEFGHIMNRMSNNSKYYLLSQTKRDFGEAMSQIFENWIGDYDILNSFAKHYKTGEEFPKDLFDNMKRAKNVSSGLNVLGGIRYAMYDLTIYDKYDPDQGINTDELWKQIDEKLGVMNHYIPDTHRQASWIHINEYPVYTYGYIWSDVYAQDMFTIFKENGLLDTPTGIKYRDLILANGGQRDIDDAVAEFLGRPSNNKAYIESLGLD